MRIAAARLLRICYPILTYLVHVSQMGQSFYPSCPCVQLYLRYRVTVLG